MPGISIVGTALCKWHFEAGEGGGRRFGRKERGAGPDGLRQVRAWPSEVLIELEGSIMAAIMDRIAAYDWDEIGQSLDVRGWARLPALLSSDECAAISALYGPGELFRSHVVMARHGFGRGEYRYFAYPLPDIVQNLRAALYPCLLPTANRWHERMNVAARFPESHEAFLERCHAAGQTRPTPLLLQYGPSDYNCLHQDIYGAVAFPLQLTAFLSRPDRDFSGGEFLLVEQRPRAQSRGEVMAPQQGEIVIFATRHRPVQGSRGHYRVNMRHGVSTVHSGSRFTLVVIFHDAQ